MGQREYLLSKNMILEKKNIKLVPYFSELKQNFYKVSNIKSDFSISFKCIFILLEKKYLYSFMKNYFTSFYKI